jgi:hypothetical protein
MPTGVLYGSDSTVDPTAADQGEKVGLKSVSGVSV